MSSALRMGPLTTMPTPQGFVVLWTPSMLNCDSQTASIAAVSTGMYSGLHPAMTAFTAIFSMVASPLAGPTLPTKWSEGRPGPFYHSPHSFLSGRDYGQAVTPTLFQYKIEDRFWRVLDFGAFGFQ